MAKFRLTPLDELVDEVWGVKGTPKRDEMEARLKEEMETSNVDEPAAVTNSRVFQRRSRATHKLELA